MGALFSFVSEVLFLFVGWEPSFSFGVSPGGSVGCCCCGATLWTNKDKQGQTIAYLTRLHVGKGTLHGTAFRVCVETQGDKVGCFYLLWKVFSN